MAFEVDLVANVEEWLAGTEQVEQSIDELAGSLDQLGTDTEESATKASETLETKFTDAFEKTRKGSRDASAQMKADTEQTATAAEEGTRRSSTAALSGIGDVAQAFDGSSASATGAVQQIAGELGALGPAAGAAGILIAAGIGVAVRRAEDDAKRLADLKDEAIDLAQALDEARGNPAAIKWAERLKAILLEIVDTKEWFEFWQDTPKTRLEEWASRAQEFEVSIQDVAAAAVGDADALARVNAQLDTVGDNLRKQSIQGAHWDFGLEARIGELDAFKQQVNDQAGTVSSATELYTQMQEALKGVSTAQAGVAASSADAKEWIDTSAAEKAADAAKDFSESLTDNLSVADEGLKAFVHKGKLHLDEWSKELHKRAKEDKQVEHFAVTIAPKLSPEALQNFARLPIDTQAQIAKAWKDGDKGDRKLIVHNLEAEAKVKTVDLKIDQAAVPTVIVPTQIDASGVVQGVAPAHAAAQKAAESNEITFATRIDVDELQRQVDRAAAAIVRPTITVKTKVAKEVP